MPLPKLTSFCLGTPRPPTGAALLPNAPARSALHSKEHTQGTNMASPCKAWFLEDACCISSLSSLSTTARSTLLAPLSVRAGRSALCHFLQREPTRRGAWEAPHSLCVASGHVGRGQQGRGRCGAGIGAIPDRGVWGGSGIASQGPPELNCERGRQQENPPKTADLHAAGLSFLNSDRQACPPKTSGLHGHRKGRGCTRLLGSDDGRPTSRSQSAASCEIPGHLLAVGNVTEGHVVGYPAHGGVRRPTSVRRGTPDARCAPGTAATR